jgi:hypothetical protein
VEIHRSWQSTLDVANGTQVIAAALRYVDSKIVEFLNIPLKDDKVYIFALLANCIGPLDVFEVLLTKIIDSTQGGL